MPVSARDASVGTGGGLAGASGGGGTSAGGGTVGAAGGEGGGTALLPDGGTADAGVEPRTDAGTPRDAGTMADAGAGPNVDRTNPQLYQFSFRPSVADPDAGQANNTQLASLDSRVASLGYLVVFLHGAGGPTTCGSLAHNTMLASFGYHVVSPCYVADYGVGNCGSDIGGCRLEAFEGVDHSPVVSIGPSDSIERRVVKMLERLRMLNPAGDWGFFIEGTRPRWSRIIITGISHGASSAGLIGLNRAVARVVMLSGPLDTNQAWLIGPSQTPKDRFWGFSHQDDSQHAGHLSAFQAMMVPGTPTNVDTTPSPYAGSHRLITNANTSDGHSSTQWGGSSPRLPDGGAVFLPVWRTMYLP